MSTKEKHTLHYKENFVMMAKDICFYLPSFTYEDIDYLDLIDGNITYLRYTAIEKLNKGCLRQWDSSVTKLLCTAKPGRVFKRLHPTYNNKDIEIYVARFLEYTANVDNYNIEIWPSNKIKFAYHEKNYAKIGGPLNNSCMRYAKTQKNLDFYIKNNVEIIVLTDNNKKILGRALLWPPMKIPSLSNKSMRMMDRIYYCKERHQAVFKKFYKEQNFIYKHDFTDNIWMPVNLDGILCLPYADTMKCLYYKDKILSRNFGHSNLKGIELKYQNTIIDLSTTAEYIEQLDPNLIIEIFSNRGYNKSKCKFIESYNDYVLIDNIIKINKKEYSALDPDICRLYNNKYDFKNNCIKSSILSSWINKNNSKAVYNIEKELDDKNKPTGNLKFKVVDYIPDDDSFIKNNSTYIYNIDDILYLKRTDTNKKLLTQHADILYQYTFVKAKEQAEKNKKANEYQLTWNWYEDASSAQFWDIDTNDNLIFNEVLI